MADKINANAGPDDLQEIVDRVLDEMRLEVGDGFDLAKVNLAEFSRRSGLTRGRARTLKDKGFKVTPHGRCGMKAETTVMTGFTGVVDDLLRKGVTNSSVCFERLREQGYAGGLTAVKNYIAAHSDLVPARRQLPDPQGNRGRRYKTEPGECFQMDWGFVEVEDPYGGTFRIACFAMVCHHCGERYVEFFPNARQESLFIGMVHAFCCMGVPKFVLTDNMKSVVVRRDADGHPIWQGDYEVFMKTLGFKTKLCKPRHPFTKGKVERLIRFVKDNFLAGRSFANITELNFEALRWCHAQNSRYSKAVDCVPEAKHLSSCMSVALPAEKTDAVVPYLCPERKISFDGFVNYEGRRFGVPYWYAKKTCRVSREGRTVHVYSDDLSTELSVHDVTWGHLDSCCADQYTDAEQPFELPTSPVKVRLAQLEPPPPEPTGFEKFNFGSVW